MIPKVSLSCTVPEELSPDYEDDLFFTYTQEEGDVREMSPFLARLQNLLLDHYEDVYGEEFDIFEASACVVTHYINEGFDADNFTITSYFDPDDGYVVIEVVHHDEALDVKIH